MRRERQYSRWCARVTAVRARTSRIDSRRSVRWTCIPNETGEMCVTSREGVMEGYGGLAREQTDNLLRALITIAGAEHHMSCSHMGAPI